MAKKFGRKLFYGEIIRSDEFYHVLFDDGDGKFCSICVSDDWRANVVAVCLCCTSQHVFVL